jgi:Cyanophycin synthase-like N-terminal domain
VSFCCDAHEVARTYLKRLGQGSIDRLPGYLPGPQQHGCSYPTPGGFVRGMHQGERTCLSHVMEHVAANLPTGGAAIDVTDSVHPGAACGWREIERVFAMMTATC